MLVLEQDTAVVVEPRQFVVAATAVGVKVADVDVAVVDHAEVVGAVAGVLELLAVAVDLVVGEEGARIADRRGDS